jgi:hypothetical protein
MLALRLRKANLELQQLAKNRRQLKKEKQATQ